MDPLSVSLGIVGVLPVVANVLVAAKRYLHGVKGAKATITNLIAELEVLHSTLDSLAVLLKDDAARNGITHFQSSSVLVRCIAACRARMTVLCDKLERGAAGDSIIKVRGGSLLWPLTQSEHEKTMEEIRRCTMWMQLALSIDNCRLLANSSGDVLEAMGRQLKEFEGIQSAVETQGQVLDDQTRLLKNRDEEEARQKLLDWVASGASVRAHSQRHAALQASRSEGTGRWLLQTKEFRNWRDGEEA